MTILLLAAMAGPWAAMAHAGDFPRTALLGIGFHVATLADFDGTPGQASRQASPDGLLALTGDFNGDGRPDEVRILLNPAEDRAGVVAAILTDQLDTYFLEQTSVAHASDLGLRLAPARDGRQGVTIFSLSDGRSETLYLEGDGFAAAAGD
jgi:hypothetical protein